MTLTESDNPSVLMAAGEALAVCAEANLMKHASPEDMDAIETKVLDLATDASGDMTRRPRNNDRSISSRRSRTSCAKASARRRRSQRR